MQGSLSASSSVYMRWTKGAQVTGLGAAAGPTPAARATQAHGPGYPAALAALAFSSCQDQLEHPTARSQPLSCVRALDVLSGHAVYLQRAALLPQCALPCFFHVRQFFATSGAGRVPNMSAPGSSDGPDGRKAKRDFPRSHFRADGTRRRTAGEKQARKSWSRRQDADDQPRRRPPAENRPQWQKKDSAQAANEGLHISGASAGQRQQPDQWSSEQDSQGSPPKPEQEPTSDASTQSTDTGSPKCPQLLIRLPDCAGIQELTRQLEGIKQTSGLGQLLISSRPKDGRWTLLLEGTQASQDKAKAIVKDLLESTQTEAPQILGSATAGHASEGAELGPGPAQASEARGSAEAPRALPLVVLPAHPSTHDLALDVSPSAEAVTGLQRSPEGAEQIVLPEEPVGRSHASDSRAYRVASLAVLPALDFVCCQPDSARPPGHCQKQPLDAEPRHSKATAPLSHRLLHFEQQVADFLATSGQHRSRSRRVRRWGLLMGAVLPARWAAGAPGLQPTGKSPWLGGL